MKWGYDLAFSERVVELFGHDTFGELLRLVEEDLRDEIFKVASPEQREQIYFEMHALNRINIKLRSIVDSSKGRVD